MPKGKTSRVCNKGQKRGGRKRGNEIKTHITKKGYVRFAKCPAWPQSNKYEHRWRMQQLIEEWNGWGWEDIPHGYHVHHMDFNKTHNCHCNLLLLDAVLHSATSFAGQQCPVTGRMLSRNEWQRRYGTQEKDEVPF